MKVSKRKDFGRWRLTFSAWATKQTPKITGAKFMLVDTGEGFNIGVYVGVHGVGLDICLYQTKSRDEWAAMIDKAFGGK